jgi:hypothetical protein
MTLFRNILALALLLTSSTAFAGYLYYPGPAVSGTIDLNTLGATSGIHIYVYAEGGSESDGTTQTWTTANAGINSWYGSTYDYSTWSTWTHSVVQATGVYKTAQGRWIAQSLSRHGAATQYNVDLGTGSITFIAYAESAPGVPSWDGSWATISW